MRGNRTSVIRSSFSLKNHQKTSQNSRDYYTVDFLSVMTLYVLVVTFFLQSRIAIFPRSIFLRSSLDKFDKSFVELLPGSELEDQSGVQ